MVRTAPSSQEGNKKPIRRQEVRASNGQRGDERPRRHEHSEQHPVAKRASSGQETEQTGGQLVAGYKALTFQEGPCTFGSSFFKLPGAFLVLDSICQFSL